MTNRKSGRIQSKAKDSEPARRTPLTDITSNALNIDQDHPRRDTASKRQKVSQENQTELNSTQDNNYTSQESALLSEATIEVAVPISDPTFHLTVQRTFPSAPNPRSRALWSLDPSSPSLFSEAQDSLPPDTRYRDVLPPSLAQNELWVVGHCESIHAHHRLLELLPRYQLDLSYAPLLKRATGTDRATLVDDILIFSHRVRLKHPTMHLAVHILDRYLAALLRPIARTSSQKGSAPTNTTGSDVEGGAELNEEAREILQLPHSLKCITSVCLWLAAKVEEQQRWFDWQRLHAELFLQVPVVEWPSEHHLHLLMNLVAKTLQHDLNAPTAYTFMCYLMPLAGFGPDEVLVARCLVERVLLEDPFSNTTTTNTSATTAPTVFSTVVQGRYPSSMIAAACVLLTRVMLVQGREDTSSNTTCGGGGGGEVVWTKELRHFSGYSAAQLHPVATTLLAMLQQETYLRGRAHARSLCPHSSGSSGNYDALVCSVAAMVGSGSTSSAATSIVDSPLQAYLSLLPSILTHLQDSLIRDTRADSNSSVCARYGKHTQHSATQDTHTTLPTRSTITPHTTNYATRHANNHTNTTMPPTTTMNSGVFGSMYTPVLFPTPSELQSVRVNALYRSASVNSSSFGGVGNSTAFRAETPLFAQSSVQQSSVYSSSRYNGTSIAGGGAGTSNGNSDVLIPTPLRRSLWLPPTNTITSVGFGGFSGLGGGGLGSIDRNTGVISHTNNTTNNATNTNTSQASTRDSAPTFRIFGQGVFRNNSTSSTNTTSNATNHNAPTITNLYADYSQLSQLSQHSQLSMQWSQECNDTSGPSGSDDSDDSGGRGDGGGEAPPMQCSTVERGSGLRHLSFDCTVTNPHPAIATTTTHTTYNNSDSFFDPYRMLYSQDGYSNQGMGGVCGVGNVNTRVRDDSGSSGVMGSGVGSVFGGGAVFGRVSSLAGASPLSFFASANGNIGRSSTAQNTSLFGISTPARTSFPTTTNASILNTTTTSNSSASSNIYNAANTTAATPSLLGRRSRSAFTTTTPMNTSTNNTTVRVVALRREVQDLYHIYPPTTTTTNTTTTNTTTANNTAAGVLDYCITHATRLPAVHNSVYQRYSDLYDRLVAAPPL